MESSNEITLREPMQLTSENVERVFKDCLAEQQEGAQVIHGVKLKVAFDRSKVSANRDNILSMLSLLPEPFQVGRGGGWSFLNICVDHDSRQWTDLHQTCDMLVCMGLAIGAVKFCFNQRELWQMFPGGMPYLSIDLQKGGEK